jgi:hypothetical protein
MVGQEGIHRALINQVAAQSRRIQQLDTTGISCPLHAGSLPHHSPTSWDPTSYLLSRLLALDQLQGRTPIVWTITALVAATSLAIWRTGLVGRRLGVAGLVAAAIFLLGSVLSVLGRTPEGGSSLAGVGLFIVWMLAVSVGLWRTPARGGV